MARDLTAARIVAGDLGRVFEQTLQLPLAELFVHWNGPLPPVRSTDGPVPWGSPGQRRTVDLVGPGRFTETLTEVVAPIHFGYRLDDIRGPMRGLVARVAGRWEFAAEPTGTKITWAWTVTAKNRMGWVLPAFAWFWNGYAERALRTLDDVLRDRD
jgi:hypothetical protein